MADWCGACHPLLDRLTNDSRFVTLLKERGIEAYIVKEEIGELSALRVRYLRLTTFPTIHLIRKGGNKIIYNRYGSDQTYEGIAEIVTSMLPIM